MVNFKRMVLTDFKIDIPRLAKKKVLTAALEESGESPFLQHSTGIIPVFLRTAPYHNDLRACPCKWCCTALKQDQGLMGGPNVGSCFH